ncbi:MAG: C-type lectin domain-containing protein [Limisphaerales bacterium]
MTLRNIIHVTAAVLVLLTTSFTASATILQTETFKGHTYHLLDSSFWNAAEAEALTLGGHLVTINDAVENAFVLSTFTNTAVAHAPPSSKISLWIGLSDAQTEGTFIWSSGAPVLFTNWAPIQPEGNVADEDYAGIFANWEYFGGTIGQWHDIVSDNRFGDVPYGVVEVVPEPTSAVLLLSGLAFCLRSRTLRTQKRNG